MVEDLSSRLSGLSPDKLALLVRRLGREGTPVSPGPALEPRRRTGPIPLSFAQERLWFLDRLEPGSGAYNVPQGVRWQGPLELAALATALGRIVARHEVLRTVYREVDGVPHQVPLPAKPVPLPLVDLSALPEDRRPGEASRRVREDAVRPFDLEAGPVLRVFVLRLAQDDHRVHFNVHHIAFDGHSAGVLRRELAAAYRQAVSHGTETPGGGLPDLPVQYADYALWQREVLQGERLEAELDWWRRSLEGLPPLLALPTDRPRTGRRGSAGGVVRHPLPAAPVAALERLAAQRRVTPFMAGLALLAALLGRWSGQDDLAVGAPASGRSRVELEPLLGFFVNTLVLRVQPGRRDSLEDLLEQVRSTARTAYDHQEVPFERLVEALVPQRSLAYTPLFQVMYELEEDAAEATTASAPAAGPRIRAATVAAERVKFDLSLTLARRADGGWTAAASFARDLFDAATLHRFLRHLERLLVQAVAEPRRPLATLDLMSRGERQQVLAEWQPPEPPPRETTVASEVLARAAERPDSVAVVAGDLHVTYGSLARRVRRLAARLRRRGVGPEARVGVFLDRSPELVVAWLAVGVAGGAYVPLDPANPPRRLAELLRDSGPRLVVTRRSLAPALPVGGMPVLEVEAGGGSSTAGEDLERSEATPRQAAAYVVYTSGSTGRPKGVVVSHGSLADYIAASARFFGLEATDRGIHFASVGFDASAEEVYTTLTGGATLELRDDGFLDPLGMVEAVQRRRMTILSLPTAAWHGLASALRSAPGALAGSALRLVVIGGEAARGDAFRSWEQEVPPGVRLVNTYGPTEGTIAATAWERDGREPAGEALPIGRAIPGDRALVVDEALRPLPPSVPGELVLGGTGVARGYLARPRRTAERFVPDPFSRRPGARLYRSGDRARWDPAGGGRLEFLGRTDDQVKVRGFRIEPGEVEAALAGLPGVAAAAVVACAASGGILLVAFWVARDPAEASGSELRSALSRRLPDWMLPSRFVAVEELPVNRNGKVDRRALVARAAEELATTAGRRQPRDRLELEVARTFQSLLHVDGIGVEDDFFTLGGHSLLAVRLLAHLEAATGVRLPLATLFRSPTVEDLARELREDARSPSFLVPLSDPSPDLREGREAGTVVLVHPVGGGVLCYRPLVAALGRRRRILALQSPGLDDDRPTPPTVPAMAELYLDEIEKGAVPGPLHLGGWSFGGLVAYEMACRLARAGRPPETLFLLDAWVPDGVQRVADERRLLERLARELGIASARLGRGEALPPLPDLDALLALAREEDLLPPAVGRQVLGRHFDILTKNDGAAMRYLPESCPARTWLLRPSRPHVPVDRGWADLVTGGLEVVHLPGDHDSFLEPPEVRFTADALLQVLNRPSREDAGLALPREEKAR